MTGTAVVTGASSGIGYETAFLLATVYKYRVFALSRNISKLNGLSARAESSGGNIIPIQVDLSANDFDVKSMLQQNNIESLEVLVNNAGLLVNKSFVKMKRFDLEQSFAVNSIAPYLLIQQLLPLLKNALNAHIVNISSMGGFQGAAKFAGLSVYSMTKAALACTTECLAEELKDTSIKVNCLCLGAVNTEMLAVAFPDYVAPLQADKMALYIAQFADGAHHVMNGKIIPVALSTP